MALHPDILPYRKPELGKHYWVTDNILPDPLAVVDRCLNKTAWVMGSPWRNEAWPGMRSQEALLPEELMIVEDWVKRQIGVQALRAQSDPPTGVSGHNYVQLVGGGDGVSRPHVDSSTLCNYAGVLYLHPYPPTKHSGTSFFRLKLPEGRLGGRVGFGRQSDLTMWEEEIEVPNVFNRLLVYKSDIVHSATSYFGWDHQIGSKRIAAVFFWMVPS